MTNRRLCRAGAALVALCAALPALADTQFQVRRMTRTDVPLGKGQCDIRLQVDNEVEVAVRRDTVHIRTIAGRDARDDGSECNAPLPDRDAANFTFEVRDKRNEIQLLAEPSRRNNHAAIIRIRDSSGGEGRYHFRLSWQMTGGDDFGRDDRPTTGRGPVFPPAADRRPSPPGKGPAFPPPGRGAPGFRWDEVVRFSGNGRGVADHSAYGSQRLSAAAVNIDRNGRLTANFRTDSGRPLILNGTVIGREGLQYRADATTEDRRIRGVLYFTMSNRNQIEAVAFEGVDGRERLRVNWDRR